MTGGRTRDLALSEARALVQRAIDKAEQLGLAGGIAVVGGSGALVTASRMDHGGAGGMARARSKAWIAATQQVPSTEHLGRMTTLPGPIERGFLLASPEAMFPGAGGMPIERDGVVVGGIATSGATVSPFFPAGIEQERMIADGRPANPEDLLIAYALGRPYVGQHGDDEERWRRAFGEFPRDAPRGLGMVDAPPAGDQPEHDDAVRRSDAVMAAAAREGLRVAVAIVDHRGDPVQQDAMDGAPSAAAFAATPVAAAAAGFALPSEEVAARYGTGETLAQLSRALPFPILAAPGGLPIAEDGRVVAGIGVAGPDPATCRRLAEAGA